jgi:peptide/nickel transport system permease protein
VLLRKLVVRRLLQAVPLLLVISSLTFVLVSLIPGSVATALLGVSGTPAEYALIERQLGLNKPVYVQYWRWLDHVFHGSLGVSLENHQSVAAVLNSRIGVTVTLILATVVVVATVGVSLGVVAAVQKGIVGRMVDGLSWLGLAIPNFWLGLLLVAFFSVFLRLLPSEGFVPFATSPLQWLKSLILPVVALAAGPLAVVVKQTRDAMVAVLNGEFIRTLRASGVKERSIVLKHALKNAALPVVTVLGVLFVQLLGGTVVVENVFALPGLGSLAVSSVSAHDLPVIEGVAVYFTLIVIAVNLLVDIAYGWLSPKVRVG